MFNNSVDIVFSFTKRPELLNIGRSEILKFQTMKIKENRLVILRDKNRNVTQVQYYEQSKKWGKKS